MYFFRNTKPEKQRPIINEITARLSSSWTLVRAPNLEGEERKTYSIGAYLLLSSFDEGNVRDVKKAYVALKTAKNVKQAFWLNFEVSGGKYSLMPSSDKHKELSTYGQITPLASEGDKPTTTAPSKDAPEATPKESVPKATGSPPSAAPPKEEPKPIVKPEETQPAKETQLAPSANKPTLYYSLTGSGTKGKTPGETANEFRVFAKAKEDLGESWNLLKGSYDDKLPKIDYTFLMLTMAQPGKLEAMYEKLKLKRKTFPDGRFYWLNYRLLSDDSLVLDESHRHASKLNDVKARIDPPLESRVFFNEPVDFELQSVLDALRNIAAK